MFRVNPIGPWKKLRALLRKYDERVIYVQKMLLQRMTEMVVDEIKKKIPDDPEYAQYTESLRAVELTGTGKKIVYGVISDRKSVKVGSLLKGDSRNKTVVYVNARSTGQPYEIADMMASVNPWPVELLPNGLDRKLVVFVHQIVTEGEYEYAKKNVTDYIRNNRSEFSRYKIKWGRIEDDETSVEGMDSLPDWMSLAVRTEFGINAKMVPHWKPTLRWADKKLASIMKDDDNIQKALYDPLFRGHLLSKVGNVKQMNVDDFSRETKNFQKKVLGA